MKTYAEMNTLDVLRLLRFPYDACNVDALRVDYLLAHIAQEYQTAHVWDRFKKHKAAYMRGYLDALQVASNTLTDEYGLGPISARRTAELQDTVYRPVNIRGLGWVHKIKNGKYHEEDAAQ